MGIAGLQIKEVDLIKRIVLLAFALEDKGLTVRRKIALAASLPLERKLADPVQKTRLSCGFGCERRGREQAQSDQ